MTAEEIRAALVACQRLPAGRPKSQQLETLAAQAKETGDRRLEAQVLVALSSAYEYGAEQERMPILFGRLLQLLDQFPAEVGTLSWTIHWRLKWMSSGLVRNPAVPLETAHRWLDELSRRYRQRGYSPRPVHAQRWELASHLGDDTTASAEMEASIAAPRDQMADCEACERNDWGRWRAALGDDAGALSFWAPLLSGARHCAEEPHRVLGLALLPLVRAGRLDDARGAYLRGYPLVRQNVNLIVPVGQHIEFCALTGNEARGLELLAEHAAWLADTHVDAVKRLSFAAGVCVLLRRLTAIGYGALPVGRGPMGPGTVESTLAALEQEVRELCDRYDARNGTTAVSDRVTSRLTQKPLLDRLPLGLPATLPPAPEPPPEAALPEAARPDAWPGTRPGTLSDLVAEARRLADLRHPHTSAAWAKVASCGQDLPPDVAASVARASAGELLGPDPKAAYPALLAVSRQFAELGDMASSWEAQAAGAMAQARVGDREEAAGTAASVIGEAEAAYAAGALTPRQYLAVRRARPLIAFETLAARADRSAADLAGTAELIGTELALAEQLGEQRYAAMFHELLAQLSSWQGDQDKFQAHLSAARALCLAAGEPWHAARPAAILGQVALQAGDPQAAEASAREALAGGADLLTNQETAQLSSLLAEAIGAQPGREAELVEAFLTAASCWEGLSEPDTLHNTFNAARTYARLDRPAEAAVLFAEVMPRVDIPYEPAVVALTREQFGNSLRELGRHREASEQFLRAAALVQDDPANAAAHARLAAAAAESLQASGQLAEALAAYQRAATLFRGLGDDVRWARCRRSAAWVQFWDPPETPAGPDAEPAGVAAMRAVFSDLEAMTAVDPSEELAAELAATSEQLTRMLTDPDPDDDDEDEDEDE